MDKEKLQAVGQKLLKRADLVAISLLLVLLVIGGFLALAEQSHTLPPIDLPQAPEWQRKIPSDDYDKIRKAFVAVQPDITKDPKVVTVVQLNMFDVKEVKKQAELDKELAQDYQAAKALYDEGKKDEALAKLEDILRKNPAHITSLELKQKIESERAGTGTAPAPAGGT